MFLYILMRVLTDILIKCNILLKVLSHFNRDKNKYPHKNNRYFDQCDT